jgi:hypothetical protein
MAISESFERGVEHLEIGKIIGFFEALVSQPEDVENRKPASSPSPRSVGPKKVKT